MPSLSLFSFTNPLKLAKHFDAVFYPDEGNYIIYTCLEDYFKHNYSCNAFVFDAPAKLDLIQNCYKDFRKQGFYYVEDTINYKSKYATIKRNLKIKPIIKKDLKKCIPQFIDKTNINIFSYIYTITFLLEDKKGIEKNIFECLKGNLSEKELKKIIKSKMPKEGVDLKQFKHYINAMVENPIWEKIKLVYVDIKKPSKYLAKKYDLDISIIKQLKKRVRKI